ncbi:MAG: c-type cytochrome biogenesis protein CcsB [Nocardioides sp.]|nr:c-type cytochrome biogenesis protein CcsB [Nocardioides sp.]
MTDAQWEVFSYEAVIAAGVLYFLAMLAYLVEWAALRRVASDEVVAEPVAVGAGSAPADAGRTPSLEEGPGRRVAMAGRLGLVLTGFATAVHLAALVGRGLAADPNRVPWGNMYEFTISGTFMVALIFLVGVKLRGVGWMGPIVVTFVLVALMAAFLGLDDAVLPLPDALNSPWLVIHVVAAVISTGAFTIGGILSILYLVKARAHPSRGYLARIPSLDRLDRLSYQMHAFGFPVWTFAVLITGPIWAHQAWGAYWNWDPKEVWAFITWVLYAAYLHARATAGWRGKGAAWLALAALATLWFNFIGINFFSTASQHSYAGEAVPVVAPAEAGSTA